MKKQNRYSKEFKEEIVQYYEEHPELGYLSIARIFDLPSDESVRRWVKQKQAHGDEAFKLKPRKKAATSPRKKIKKKS
ncbi:transposase [Bacillus tianshenii]|nr:transposase [Bacillus tianshenii]